MQDLTLVGVSDDGEHLVLSGADGQRFRVRVDEPLRAAVRRDRARMGQLQLAQEGRLRPRDIQARIRAGHSAQEIADEANLPLEHVQRFEGPVLAEREFIARQARGVRVRRPGVSAQPTLGDLVGERLSRRDLEEDDAVWDSYRRDDGQWVVTLTFPSGGRTRGATWAFDPQLRHVTPLDDESRWLTEDDAPEPGAPPPPGARRLAPVPDPLRSARARDTVFDVEADGAARPGDDPAPAPRREPAPAPRREPAPAPAPRRFDPPAARTEQPPLPEAPVPTSAAGQSTVDLLDSLRERRGRRQRPVAEHEADGVVAPQDPPAETSAPRPDEPVEPAAAVPPRSRPERASEVEVVRLPEEEVDLVAAEKPRPEPAAPSAPLPKAAGAAAGRPSRKNRRASVPSWDDIVFGSKRE